MTLAAFIPVFATLVAAAAAQAQCPAPGDCREVHETPGCEMPECCEIVCKINPLCCDFGWDQGCVDLALEECDGINCPADGDCGAAHPTPGCSDYGCCDLIVTIDPWCTFASWDEICANAAARYCGASTCEIAASKAPDEEEPCYERLNDGWASGIVSARIETDCDAALQGRLFAGGPRDLEWFSLEGAARVRRAFTVEAEFPVELQLLLGGEDGPNEVRWLAPLGLCDGERTVNFLVPAGTVTLILGVGDADRSWRSALDCDQIDPDNPPDPDDPPPVQVTGTRWVVRVGCLPLGDIDGDGSVGATDLGALLNAWGPIDPGLPFDPLAPDADLNGDGDVGGQDLAILLGGW
jgi:hypothetical protein